MISELKFEHHASTAPTRLSSSRRLIPQVRKAVEHYLRGTGHPFPERARALAELETFDDENNDPTLRARRFVKALSGLEMMPISGQAFTVCFKIPWKKMNS